MIFLPCIICIAAIGIGLLCCCPTDPPTFDCTGCQETGFPDEMEVTVTGFPNDTFCDFEQTDPCSDINGTYTLQQVDVGSQAPCFWQYDHPNDDSCMSSTVVSVTLEDVGGDWYVRVDISASQGRWRFNTNKDVATEEVDCGAIDQVAPWWSDLFPNDCTQFNQNDVTVHVRGV